MPKKKSTSIAIVSPITEAGTCSNCKNIAQQNLFKHNLKDLVLASRAVLQRTMRPDEATLINLNDFNSLLDEPFDFFLLTPRSDKEVYDPVLLQKYGYDESK